MKRNKVWMLLMMGIVFAVNGAAKNSPLMIASDSVLKSNAEDKPVIQSKDNWYFLRSELNYMAKGTFWGEDILQNEAAAAIIDFNQQLKEQGITLLVVPVPAKAEVYPHHLFSDLALIDQYPMSEFYQQLGKKGVQVIDLFPLYQKASRDSTKPMIYCRQDSHWSGYGLELAAGFIAEPIKKAKWYQPQASFTKTPIKMDILGDLAKESGDTTLTPESMSLKKVEGVTTSEASPVLVIGDSHTLIFHAGDDMLAEKSGFVDILAADLKMPVDLIGVRGSGATPVRVNLYRKASKQPDWLKSKKVIIWCFTVREFTQSQSGWKIIPLFKK